MTFARIAYERKKLNETLIRNKGAGKHTGKKARVKRKDDRRLLEN